MNLEMHNTNIISQRQKKITKYCYGFWQLLITVICVFCIYLGFCDKFWFNEKNTLESVMRTVIVLFGFLTILIQIMIIFFSYSCNMEMIVAALWIWNIISFFLFCMFVVLFHEQRFHDVIILIFECFLIVCWIVHLGVGFIFGLRYFW